MHVLVMPHRITTAAFLIACGAFSACLTFSAFKAEAANAAAKSKDSSRDVPTCKHTPIPPDEYARELAQEKVKKKTLKDVYLGLKEVAEALHKVGTVSASIDITLDEDKGAIKGTINRADAVVCERLQEKAADGEKTTQTSDSAKTGGDSAKAGKAVEEPGFEPQEAEFSVDPSIAGLIGPNVTRILDAASSAELQRVEAKPKSQTGNLRDFLVVERIGKIDADAYQRLKRLLLSDASRYVKSDVNVKTCPAYPELVISVEHASNKSQEREYVDVIFSKTCAAVLFRLNKDPKNNRGVLYFDPMSASFDDFVREIAAQGQEKSS